MCDENQLKRSKDKTNHHNAQVDYVHQYGVTITFPDPLKYHISHSPTWSIARWDFEFVKLAPYCEYHLNPNGKKKVNLVKTVFGYLCNIAEGNTVTAPKERRSCLLPLGLTVLRAGADGACFCLWWVSEEDFLRGSITTMDDIPKSGMYMEKMKWVKYEHIDPAFKGREFYNFRGFKLQEHNGKHITYIQFWTVGLGVDAGYHNHSNLTKETRFCETHMTLFNGSGWGGMQYKTTTSDPLHNVTVENMITLPPGYEHGPLWFVDNESGKPVMNPEKEIVLYPDHRWKPGNNKATEGQAFDVWVAFEMLPEQSIVLNRNLAKL